MNKKNFVYPSELASEERMYDQIKEFLIEAGLTPRMFQKVMLPISEAFTNALVHGNEFIADKKIIISITVNDDVVLVDIIDEGEGDLSPLKYRKLSGPLEEGGRGIDLMSKLADRLEIRKNDDSRGWWISMTFDRNAHEYKQKQI